MDKKETSKEDDGWIRINVRCPACDAIIDILALHFNLKLQILVEWICPRCGRSDATPCSLIAAATELVKQKIWKKKKNGGGNGDPKN